MLARPQRSSTTLTTSWALSLAIAAGGCVGSIGAGDSPGGGGQGTQGPSVPGVQTPGQPNTPGVNGPGNPAQPTMPGVPVNPPLGTGPVDPEAVGVMPLRRLDQREYNNTVRDLLGDTTRPGDKFPSDRESEFAFRHAGLVSSLDYSTIQEAAEALAAAAERNVGTLAPCPAGTAEEACARTFATNFGLRAYRRPVEPQEVDNLVALYKEVRQAPLSLPHAGGIRVMIEGMLQSPAFLYHWEAGSAKPTLEGKVVKLGHYENASQLSYFIWGSMPDSALFEAAAAGKLGTAAELEAHAKRMLGDPRARETVSEFFEHWLGLDQVMERPKDPKAYPEFKDELRTAMLAEARAFVSNVVFDGDGKLNTLLTATHSFLNGPLAQIYGVQGMTGAELKQAMLAPNQRAGLLTQTAFLTVTGATDGSHPVKRGKKVYERLMCGELPPPPADVPNPKPASEGGTTRQRFAEHGENGCAKGCHALIDPLGFAFEHYDGIGKWRTTDNGGMVDASGSIELDGAKKDFKDARDLVQHLAGSATVRNCFATQWTRYALKRHEQNGDRAALAAIQAVFGRPDSTVRDLMVGVVGSRSFRYRAPAQGENLQ